MPPRPQRRARPRRSWESYAAPIAFLVAATVAVLLVRSAFQHPAPTTTTATTRAATTTVAKKTRKPAATSTAAAKLYVVQAGDSFGAIAAKTGTSVAEIERLNPGVASTSLHVGQKIRVG